MFTYHATGWCCHYNYHLRRRSCHLCRWRKAVYRSCLRCHRQYSTIRTPFYRIIMQLAIKGVRGCFTPQANHRYSFKNQLKTKLYKDCQTKQSWFMFKDKSFYKPIGKCACKVIFHFQQLKLKTNLQDQFTSMLYAPASLINQRPISNRWPFSFSYRHIRLAIYLLYRFMTRLNDYIFM